MKNAIQSFKKIFGSFGNISSFLIYWLALFDLNLNIFCSEDLAIVFRNFILLNVHKKVHGGPSPSKHKNCQIMDFYLYGKINRN